ncbi:MAG: polysaccharide biosynthesis tyrosine autokinase [Cyanobacteria bacterium CRU_2_1]|nr:polysaccharide biosynthesis tyrosine autokinase [Cyanobacteria bacterium RU_5_0]NJR63220.1 polysaccharide biosynthesis tyrosine autokinase [Cyanobacteria bacterium CRU_2_1]
MKSETKPGQYLQPLPLVNPVQPVEGDEGGLELGQLFATLRRRVLLIVGVAAAITLAAGVKSFSDTPIYAAKFEILVQPNTAETEVLSTVPETLSEQQSVPQSSKVVNQDLLRILVSPKILIPVVQEFQKRYPDICNQFVIPSGGDASTIAISDEELTNLCYRYIVSNLAVSALGKDSNIIQAVYKGQNPNEVRAVLNLLSEAYLNYSLESRQADINRGISFVEDKLPDLRDRVEFLQEQLQQLRQRYNLIDPTSRGGELSSQLNAFTQQQLQSGIELEQAQERSANLQDQLSQLSSESAASSVLSQSPRFQALVNQLLALDAQIAEASSIYLETTPDLQVLLEQRANLLSLLEREGEQAQREAESQLRELEVRDQALQETLGGLKTDVNQLSVISREYTDIQRELQVSTETLNQFLAKREALQIDAAQREIPWELLAPTTDPNPSVANVPRNLILGAVLGLLLGIGAAIVIEKLTDIIYTSEELKRLTRLPLLGVIPFNESLQESKGSVNFAASIQQVSSAIGRGEDGNDGRSNNERPRYESVDSFSEAFRSFYTNIRLLNSDSPIRSLIVSSTLPAEGKSTTAVYLARAAAGMTQRVLLVDTDLRHPRLHEYLNLPNSSGLSDVISGDISFKDAIQRSPLQPNMYVLTAGSIPPDPTRVLSSQKMLRLMEQFHTTFDFVIYDAPPLVGFADTYLTAAHTNGIVLVSKLGKVKRSQLGQALEQIRVSSTFVLGVVLQKQATS